MPSSSLDDFVKSKMTQIFDVLHIQKSPFANCLYKLKKTLRLLIMNKSINQLRVDLLLV